MRVFAVTAAAFRAPTVEALDGVFEIALRVVVPTCHLAEQLSRVKDQVGHDEMNETAGAEGVVPRDKSAVRVCRVEMLERVAAIDFVDGASRPMR